MKKPNFKYNLPSYSEKLLESFNSRMQGLKSSLGYSDYSPFRNEPFIDIKTPTGLIDMSNTGTPLFANGKFLPPYSGLHSMGTTNVREIPARNIQNFKVKFPSKKQLDKKFRLSGNVNPSINFNSPYLLDLYGRLRGDYSLNKNVNIFGEATTSTTDGTNFNPATIRGGLNINFQNGGSPFQPAKRKGVRNNPDGSESTHLMRTETIDGINWVSFPTLFQNEDGTWLDLSQEENWKIPMMEARKRGEVVHFGQDKEAALKFGEGSWKMQNGGGWKEKAVRFFSPKTADKIEDAENKFEGYSNPNANRILNMFLGNDANYELQNVDAYNLDADIVNTNTGKVDKTLTNFAKRNISNAKKLNKIYEDYNLDKASSWTDYVDPFFSWNPFDDEASENRETLYNVASDIYKTYPNEVNRHWVNFRDKTLQQVDDAWVEGRDNVVNTVDDAWVNTRDAVSNTAKNVWNWATDWQDGGEPKYQVEVIKYPLGYRGMPPGHIEARVLNVEDLPEKYKGQKTYVNRWVDDGGNKPVPTSSNYASKEGVQTLILELNADDLDTFMKRAQTFKEGETSDFYAYNPFHGGFDITDPSSWLEKEEFSLPIGSGDQEVEYDLAKSNCADGVCWALGIDDDKYTTYFPNLLGGAQIGDITTPQQVYDGLLNDPRILSNSVTGSPTAMELALKGNQVPLNLANRIINMYATPFHMASYAIDKTGEGIDYIEDNTDLQFDWEGVKNIPGYHYDNWIKPTGDFIEDTWEDTKDVAEDTWEGVKYYSNPFNWFADGGSLPKAQDGTEGGVFGSAGEGDVITLDEGSNNPGMDFIRKWTNSPMHYQMLSKEDPANVNFLTNARLSNLENVNTYYHSVPDADNPTRGGFSYKYHPEVHMFPVSTGTRTEEHEYSHQSDKAIDLDTAYSNFGLSDWFNLALNHEPLTLGVNTLYKFYTGDNEGFLPGVPDPSQYSTDDIYTSGRLIPKSSLDLTEELRFNENLEGNWYDSRAKELEEEAENLEEGSEEYNSAMEKAESYSDWANYVTNPTEVRARLNVIRSGASELGIYDPFNEPINEEQFKELLKNEEKLIDGDQDFNPLNQLRDIYSDDEIFKMLNTISYNTDETPGAQSIASDEMMARYGGSLPKAQNGISGYNPYALQDQVAVQDNTYVHIPPPIIPTSIPTSNTSSEDNGWSFSDWGHGILDAAGLFPGLGEIADGVNALWYAAEGDKTNAALSTAAMLPFFGWGATAAKAGNKAIKATDKTIDVVKNVTPKWSKGVTHYGDAGVEGVQNALAGMKSQGKYLDDMNFDASTLIGKNIVHHGPQYGRQVVEVALPNGRTQLFYKSSGLAGKSGKGVAGTTEGLWQPYGGHATHIIPGHGKVDNWFIKDAGYSDFYGSKSFRDIAGNLDRIAAEEGWDMSGQLLKSNVKKTGGDIDFNSLQKGIKWVESLNGELMKNPHSSASGYYGQLFDEIEYDGTRDEFIADTDYQDELFRKRAHGEIKDVPGLIDNGIQLSESYKDVDHGYSPLEIAALSNFLGRQGTREYLGYVVRDGDSLAEVFPHLYGPDVKQANKTPDEYIEKFREGLSKESKGGEFLNKIKRLNQQLKIFNSGGRISPLAKQELIKLEMIKPEMQQGGAVQQNSYVTKRGDNLSRIARNNNMTLAELLRLNPRFASNPSAIGIGDVIQLSDAPIQNNSTPNMIYEVERGDSLSKIASRYGVRYQDIAALNNISDPSKIMPGQQIRLPDNAVASGPNVVAQRQRANSVYIPSQANIYVNSNTNVNEVWNKRRRVNGAWTNNGRRALINEINKDTQANRIVRGMNDNAESQTINYTIQSGDMLGKIAQKNGVSVKKLMEDNNITDPTKIQPGQNLTINKSSGKPYLVVDEKAGRMHMYYPGSDQPFKSYPIVSGLIAGDQQTKTVVSFYKDGEKLDQDQINTLMKENDFDEVGQIASLPGYSSKTDWNLGNKSTGAGVYTIGQVNEDSGFYDETGQGRNAPSFVLKNQAGDEPGTVIHATPHAGMRGRLNALKYGTSGDDQRDMNVGTNGCINGTCSAMIELFENPDIGEGTQVFILPEDDGNNFVYENGKVNFYTKAANDEAAETYMAVGPDGKPGTADDIEMENRIGLNETPFDQQGNYKPINITFDKEYYQTNSPRYDGLAEGEEAEFNDATKPFLNSLVDNKKYLMETLGMDGDTYNDLSLIAFGIYGYESGMGDTNSMAENIIKGGTKFFGVQQTNPDVQTKQGFQNIKNMLTGEDGDWDSVGYTQAKWGWIAKDENAMKIMDKLGIDESNYEEWMMDPEKNAQFTIARLYDFHQKEQASISLKNQKIREENEAVGRATDPEELIEYDPYTSLPNRWSPTSPGYVDKVNEYTQYITLTETDVEDLDNNLIVKGEYSDDNEASRERQRNKDWEEKILNPAETLEFLRLDARDAIDDVTGGAASYVGEVYDDTVEAVGDAITSGVDAVEGAITSGVDAVSDAVDEVGEWWDEVDLNPFWKLGGEFGVRNQVQFYNDYISGVYKGTRQENSANKLYDKLNRMYYNDSKKSGKSQIDVMRSILHNNR